MRLRKVGIEQKRSIIAFERFDSPPERFQSIAAVEVRLQIAGLPRNRLVIARDRFLEAPEPLEHSAAVEMGRCLTGRRLDGAGQKALAFVETAELCLQHAQHMQCVELGVLARQNRPIAFGGLGQIAGLMQGQRVSEQRFG